MLGSDDGMIIDNTVGLHNSSRENRESREASQRHDDKKFEIVVKKASN